MSMRLTREEREEDVLSGERGTTFVRQEQLLSMISSKRRKESSQFSVHISMCVCLSLDMIKIDTNISRNLSMINRSWEIMFQLPYVYVEILKSREGLS